MSKELNAPVAEAIEQIRQQFVRSTILVDPDGSGGARLVIEDVPLGLPYVQSATWLGAHIPAQMPYSDIYPVFVRGDLNRSDSKVLAAPITAGHEFMDRPAVQISRRTKNATLTKQNAAMKIQKVLKFMLEVN